MDGAEGIMWYGRNQRGLGVSERFLEVVLHRDDPKGTLAQPPPRGWCFQGQAWLSHPRPSQSWGCCGLVLSVLPTPRGNRRRPRGKGEHSLSMAQVGGGAPTAVHGLGWAAQSSFVHGHGWLSSAWLERWCMRRVGRGVVWHLPWAHRINLL